MWEAVSSRVVTARLKWVGRRQRRRGSSRETSEVFVSVVSAYAPTALAAPGVKVKLAMNCKMLLTKFLDAWHQLTRCGGEGLCWGHSGASAGGSRDGVARVTVWILCSTSVAGEGQRTSRFLFTIFVDLRKSYDSVPKEPLWQVLERCGVTPRMLKVVKSFHVGMQPMVRVGASVSHNFEVYNGLRQGCTLAPTLFNLYFSAVVAVDEGAVLRLE